MKILSGHVVGLRNKLAKAFKSTRYKRPVSWQYPGILEDEYAKVIDKEIADRWIAIIEKELFPWLDHICHDLSIKFDAPSPLEYVIGKVRGMLIGVVNERSYQIAETYGMKINNFNRLQAGKVIQTALGEDIVFNDLPVPDIRKQFIAKNVSLIRGLSDEVANRLQTKIYIGIDKGYTAEQLKQYIAKGTGLEKGVFRTIKTRCELIARDQIGKLNGQLTKMRQLAIGVKSYIWRTQRDERVRKEHKAREGKLVFWNNPPHDGHPGEAIQCRCYAEPNLKDLTDDLN